MEVSHTETNHQNSVAENQLHKLTSMSGHGTHTTQTNPIHIGTQHWGKLQEQKHFQTVEAEGIWGQSGLRGETLPQQTISKRQTKLTALLQKIHSKGKEEGRQREEERREEKEEGEREAGGREKRKRKNLLLLSLRPWENYHWSASIHRQIFGANLIRT